jgi:hypothetical protein
VTTDVGSDDQGPCATTRTGAENGQWDVQTAADHDERSSGSARVLTYDEPMALLDEATCSRLLATAHLGRLGFTDRAMPAIVPVTYAVQDDVVFIPARSDGSLLTAVRGSVVALQVDSYVDGLGPGWSVTVVGPARVIRRPETIAGIEALDLFPGGAAHPRGYVTVQLALVRGWCLGLPGLGLPGAVGGAATWAPEGLPPLPQDA